MLIVAAAGHTVLVWRGFPVLRILYVKAGFEARPLYERWNSFSRIRVFGNPDADEKPYALGPEPEAARPIGAFKQLHLDIDVAAGTVLTKEPATPAELEHLKYDVTNIGYYLRPEGRRAGRRRRRRPRRPVGAALRRDDGRPASRSTPTSSRR